MRQASVTHAGIFAAGEGSRLKTAWPNMPKPLLPVLGVPLCHWVVAGLTQAGVTHITFLLNSSGQAARQSLTKTFPKVTWTFIVEDTASSWESFRLVASALARQTPHFALSTVDALVKPQEIEKFIAQASLARTPAAVALTDFVDDEKPLWADLDDKGFIAAFGSSALMRRHATSGLYYLSADLVGQMPEAARYTALRQYWERLVLDGISIAGIVLSKTLDVDRPQDLAAAEDFVRSFFLMPKCLAILREPQNSPNREPDDAAILQAVLEQLHIHRVETALVKPEFIDEEDLRGWDMVLPMCETYPRLKKLGVAAQSSATIFINRPQSVLGCYRLRLMATLAQTAGVLIPETEVRAVSESKEMPAPAFNSAGGFWVKRGDVHNTCSQDVVFARDLLDAEDIRRDFARREIATLLLQRHIDGDLIKFYGVGPGQWFTWFYHDPQSARRFAFHPEQLAHQVEKAAAAVDLQVFGGDAIVSPDGRVYLIDLNSWPSFARVRAEAAVQIARAALWSLRPRKVGHAN